MKPQQKSSKPLPIAIATLLQREGVLTFRKCRKYREIGFWKPVLVAKFAENDPQMASKACLKDGKWTPRSPALLAITFYGVCGTLVCKKELKWTKNFNALYLHFAKCNENPFWRFGTDMVTMYVLCIQPLVMLNMEKERNYDQATIHLGVVWMEVHWSQEKIKPC